MKKALISLIIFVFCVLMVSCGGSSNDSGDTDTSTDTDTDTDTDTNDNPDTATDTDPTEPTDEPTNPTDEPTNPTDEPTNPTDEPTEPVAGNCNEGETRLGETVCGSTQHGKLYQVCKDGDWEDTEKCTCDPGEYPEVCGYYAQKMWFTSSSDVPLVGNLAEGWTRTYFHIVQEQEQDKIHIKATYCNIKIDNDKSNLLKIIMPQSFADALGTADKESVITKNEDGTFGFDQDVFWEIRGIDPACYGDNPAGYTLPTDANDPCVQDWDNDGLPGLTVNTTGLASATMGMVEKSSSMIHDGVISEDGSTINALVDWTDEQKILYTDKNALKNGAKNNQKDPSDNFEGDSNFIEQFKIPEGSDCAYIVTNAGTIFSADPVELK